MAVKKGDRVIEVTVMTGLTVLAFLHKLFIYNCHVVTTCEETCMHNM